MAKPFVPWSKEKSERVRARNAALRETSDRCIAAGLEAIRKGEDIQAAVDAAREEAKPKPEPEPPYMKLLEPRQVGVDGWTADMQRAFVTTLADTGSVSHAAKAAGVSRSTAYAMRNRLAHATFALAWDVAIQLGRKRLLDIAMERAIEGQEIAVWHRGEQVGTRTVFNDRLLTFLIGHTPAPAHPVLTPYELAASFPRLLDTIDVLGPHPVAARLAAERAAAEEAARAEDGLEEEDEI